MADDAGESEDAGVRYCAWCRRWYRNGKWMPLELDDTLPAVMSHTICVECAEKVLRGELQPERPPGGAEADELLRRGQELERETTQLHERGDESEEERRSR
jgi:superfamily II helicase